jgi:Fe-S cluster biogenesis protein NfuA
MSQIISIDKLQELIEEDINPALAMHSGFCVLDAVEDEKDGEPPKVFLSFFGGCDGCPSAFTSTLAQIQNLLRAELEIETLEVINTETT